jgi:ribosomal-protein-serine acetyltransferase
MNTLPQNIPARIETERLVLRCYQPGDGQWYYLMSQKNRRHLGQFEAGNAVMAIQSEADAEKIVENFAAAWQAGEAYFLAALQRDTGEFVAQIYIGVVNRSLPEYEIGYFADAGHQGLGYVTEAVRASLGFVFEHLKARRVSLQCDDTNLKSARVAERCGFVREGHIRENHKWPDGTFSGTLHFGILRSEYPSVK